MRWGKGGRERERERGERERERERELICIERARALIFQEASGASRALHFLNPRYGQSYTTGAARCLRFFVYPRLFSGINIFGLHAGI